MQRNTDNYNKAQTLPIDEFNLRNQDYLRNRKNDFDAYDYDADFRQGNANFIKDDPNKITSNCNIYYFEINFLFLFRSSEKNS